MSRVASKPIEKKSRRITAKKNVLIPEGRGKATISIKEINIATQTSDDKRESISTEKTENYVITNVNCKKKF